MKRAILLLLLLTGSIALIPQEFYRSNSLAMELEIIEGPVVREKEEGWVLEVREDEGKETLILYHEGFEHSRIEREYSRKGFLTRNTQYEDGKLKEETFYNDRGLVFKEITYGESGKPLEIKNYQYSENEEPNSLTISNSGQNESTRFLSLRSDGSLRYVETKSGEEVVGSSSVNAYNGAFYMEEQYEGAVRVLRFRNKEGQLEKTVRLLNDKVLNEESRFYRTDGSLSRVVIEDFSSERRISQLMNDLGLMTSKEVYLRDDLEERTSFYYDSDLLIRKELRGPGRRETWTYEYEGENLSIEEYYEKGTLETRKYYEGEDRQNYTMEIYDRGVLFLKAYFQKDVKIREEFISEGKVTRTREWGNNE